MPNKLEKALRRQDRDKQDKKQELSGTMGIVVNGVQTVEVANRPGFVYVLLNTKEQELIQAFNDKVSTLFGLAVIVVWSVNRYEVLRKDDVRYGTWNSNYLPKHGNQHSFNPDGGGAGDVSFIYGKQFVPLSLTPSGQFGAPVAIVAPYSQQNSGWHYIDSTATPNITAHRPTNNTAKMVLVCLDWNTQTPQLIIGTGTFSAALTGSADVIPYLPATTGAFQIPIAGVRLVSGTTAVTWQNIYDVRQYFHPIFTGTSAGGGGGGGGGTGSSFAIFGNTSTPNDSIANGDSLEPVTLADQIVDDANLCNLSADELTFNVAGYYNIHVVINVIDTNNFGNGKLEAYILTDAAGYVGGGLFDYPTSADDANADVTFDFDTSIEIEQGEKISVGFFNDSGGTVFVNLTEVRIESLAGGGGGSVTINRGTSAGIMGWDEGVPLGTGTVLNVVGAGATLSLSGTVLNLNVPGGGSTFTGVDQIGVYALDDGVPVGSGSTVNFGNNLSVVRTGTTLFVDAVAGAGGGGGLGVVGWDEGVPVGTGTILNVVGDGATLTRSGTVLNLSVPGGVGSSYITTIYDQTAPAAGTSSFDVEISGTFSRIEIMINGKTESVSTNDAINLTFNNDTTDANYRYGQHRAAGASHAYSAGDGRRVAALPAANSTRPHSPGSFLISVLDPFNSSFEKSARGGGGMRFATDSEFWEYYMQWENTSPINRLTLTVNSGSDFTSGTHCKMYGYT